MAPWQAHPHLSSHSLSIWPYMPRVRKELCSWTLKQRSSKRSSMKHWCKNKKNIKSCAPTQQVP
eukprot:4790822-Amphidinium_carterae.1